MELLAHHKLILLALVFILSGVVLGANTLKEADPCTGEWSNCKHAYSDDDLRSTANAADRLGIWHYNVSIPVNAAIDKVLIRTDFFATSETSGLDLKTIKSGNLGLSHVIPASTEEKTIWTDVTSDFNWTAEDFQDFEIRGACFKMKSGRSMCSLDYIAVSVNYTIPAGNSS